MKIVKKILSLVAILSATISVFGLTILKPTNAAAVNLTAGQEINVTGVSGTLSSINVKVEFTTNVELDGTNNALLVGLQAADGTVLTDDKFIASSTNAGVYDEDDVAIVFEQTPTTIGTKTAVESNFKYTFETKDFTVVNGEKEIGKLVVIGQKGTVVASEISFTEVKYLVKFDSTETQYSYNEVVTAPQDPTKAADINNHYTFNSWIDGQENAFVTGTKATKDMTFTSKFDSEAHNWQDIAAVAPTETTSGNIAHQACACGAIRLDATSTTLSTSADVFLPDTSHKHAYTPSFDWTSATLDSNKPVITFTCECEDDFVVDAANITISEKADSRQNSTCKQKGSVVFIASTIYESKTYTDEHTFELPLAAHTPVHHDAKASTLDENGNIEYWSCSVCNSLFTDSACTQATTLEGVTLAKLTLEDAQVVSVKDIAGGATSIGLGNKSYKYTLTKTYKSTSLQFKWNIVEIASDSDRLRFHNYFVSSNVWNDACAAWYVTNSNICSLNTSAGYKFKTCQYSTGLHTVEFRTQAIMNGTTPTGDYLITQIIDGTVIDQCIKAFKLSDMTGDLYINGSATKNSLYDISLETIPYVAPVELTVSDLPNLGVIENVEGTLYDYKATTNHYSRVFKYNLTLTKSTDKSEFYIYFGEDDSCRLWLQPGNQNNFFFGWALDGHPTDKYFLDGNKNSSLEVGKSYSVEIARITYSDTLDLVYLKIDGKYLYTSVDKDNKPTGNASIFFVNKKAEKGFPLKVNKIKVKAINFKIEDIVNKNLTLEEAQVVSVNDLKDYNDNEQFNNVLLLDSNKVKYEFTKQYHSTSIEFKIDYNATERFRFHNYVDMEVSEGWWNTSCAVWLVCDQTKLGLNSTLAKDFVWNSLSYKAGLHTIKLKTQAILSNGEFTGKYMVTAEWDGVVINQVVNEYTTERMSHSNIFFNGSKTWNTLYDIDYVEDTLQEAQEVNVYDLNTAGRILTHNNEISYTYTGSTENYSRIFKFDLCLTDASNSELGVDLGNGYNCRLWLQPNKTNKFYFAWDVDGHWTDYYSIDGNGETSLDTGINYTVEIGRIRVLEGSNKGKDLIYIKVDDKYLLRTNNGPYMKACFYADPTAENGKPITKNKISFKVKGFEIYDVNYVEPTYETADVISVNDLAINGTYQNASIDALETRTYSYNGKSQYGSVIFKGTFNFASANYDNGDNNGIQIHFVNTWKKYGLIWFNGSAGVLITDINGDYVFADNIAKDKDVTVEIGRLAIMNGETFTGKHYIYVKADGVIVNEYVVSGIPEEEYTQKVLYITGKEGNGTNVIKNIAIEKKVTIKVDSHSEDLTVLQSGLVVLPDLTQYIPANKIITGWTIEGTTTKFNVLADRVFDDVVIVATIEDHKFKVVFGNEEYFFVDNSEITVPTTNPTKQADETNHYVFTGWVDGEGESFVAGTLATEDLVLYAKFNAVTHTYGDWNVVTQPTCDTVGSKTRECSCGYIETAEIPATHKLVHHAASPATCIANGTIEYWECSECETKFADEAATTVITDIVELAHHTYVHHDAVASTCIEHGTIEHYTCSGCDKLFAATEAKDEITSTEAPFAAHTLTHVPAVTPNCEHGGNIEYWSCSVCNKKFSDENGTTEVENVALPITHRITHVERVEATYEEEGNIEYWMCTECQKRFADEACTQEITDANSLIIPKLIKEEEPPKVGCFSSVSVTSFVSLALMAAYVFMKKKRA